MAFAGRSAFPIALSLSFLVFVPPGYSQDRAGRTYETGQTDASRLGLRTLARTIPPVDLPVQAAAQRRISASVRASLRILGQPPEGGPYGDARDECKTTLSKFDWRDHGGVTAVRDQGACGSCFVFGSMAAFEASWRIVNKQEIDTSEQQILDCAKAGSCSGGWHAGVFNFARDKGVASEAAIPYSGKASGVCRVVAGPSYSAVNWEYIDGQGAKPPVADIKRALCEHGPVVAAVLATDDFLNYTSGIFNENAQGSDPSNVNHDIAIVGWDDDEQVWIIKNSWKANWGEKGFMRIKYESNNIGYAAAWVDAAKAGIPLATIRSVTQTAIRHLPAGDRRSLLELRLLPR